MPALHTQIQTLSPLMSNVINFCARRHLLPESYLYGLVDVVRVGTYMPTYFFSKLYAHGQWFYFPVILSLKWSVGVIGLLLLAIVAFFSGYVRRPREVFFLALPALFYLGVAMASPLNIGVRHLLPLFPFAFSLAGAGAEGLVVGRRVWAWPVAGLLLWHAVDRCACSRTTCPMPTFYGAGRPTRMSILTPQRNGDKISICQRLGEATRSKGLLDHALSCAFSAA